jgi:hypothetical protein
LVETLLRKRRVLVIVDRLSEHSLETQRYVERIYRSASVHALLPGSLFARRRLHSQAVPATGGNRSAAAARMGESACAGSHPAANRQRCASRTERDGIQPRLIRAGPHRRDARRRRGRSRVQGR